MKYTIESSLSKDETDKILDEFFSSVKRTLKRIAEDETGISDLVSIEIEEDGIVNKLSFKVEAD